MKNQFSQNSQFVLSLLEQKKVNEAQDYFNKIKRVESIQDKNESLYLEMVLSSHQAEYDKAYKIGEMLMSFLGNSNPYVRFHHARNCIAVGEWKKALFLFDSVRNNNLFGGQYLTSKKPIWDGQDLSGKILFIASEGGLGDAVCFARFASNFEKMGAKVILGTYAPLFELFRATKGVVAQIDRSAVDLCDFDYWVPALSCPRLLNLDFFDIDGGAYIQCPSIYLEKWSKLIRGTRLRVGLCWQGNPSFAEDSVRSIDGRLFEDILNIKEIEFYKVQMHSENNLVQHENLIDLTGHVQNPLDLAGFIEQMDLFVSVDSGMAHVAGALGCPTILLNRLMGWFTFGYKPDHEKLQNTPWYNSMQILHQKKWGQWDEVIDRLKSILLEKI